MPQARREAARRRAPKQMHKQPAVALWLGPQGGKGPHLRWRLVKGEVARRAPTRKVQEQRYHRNGVHRANTGPSHGKRSAGDGRMTGQ
jgi:hypothetical protein